MFGNHSTLAAVSQQSESVQQTQKEKVPQSAPTPVHRTFQQALSSFAKDGFQLQDKLAYRQYRYLTTRGLESIKHYFLYLFAGGAFYLFAGGAFGDMMRSFANVKALVESGADPADLRFYVQCCKVERLYRAFQGNRTNATYKALEEAFEALHREFGRANTQVTNQILVDKLGEDVRAQLLTYAAFGGGKKFRQKLQMLFANYKMVVHTKEGLGYGTNAEIRQIFGKALEERLNTEKGHKAAISLMNQEKLDCDVQKISDRVTKVLATGQIDETLGAYGLPVNEQRGMLSLAATITLLHETQKAVQAKPESALHEVTYGKLFHIYKALNVTPRQLAEIDASLFKVIGAIEELDNNLKELELRQQNSTNEEEKKSIQGVKERSQVVLDRLKQFRVSIAKQELRNLDIERGLRDAIDRALCFKLRVDDETGCVSHVAEAFSLKVRARLVQACKLLVATLAPKEQPQGSSSDEDQFFSLESSGNSSGSSSEEEVSSDVIFIK